MKIKAEKAAEKARVVRLCPRLKLSSPWTSAHPLILHPPPSQEEAERKDEAERLANPEQWSSKLREEQEVRLVGCCALA